MTEERPKRKRGQEEEGQPMGILLRPIKFIFRNIAWVLVFLLGAGMVILVTNNPISQGISQIFNPTYDVTGTVVLERIQALSQLTTTRYNYSSIITSERELPPILAGLYGDSLVLVAVGHVVAGVDLSQLDAEDVRVNGNVIDVVLPPPTLFDCFLNESQSYIVERSTGLFAAPAPELDAGARRFAVQQFRNSALNEGILEAAQQQAEQVIVELFQLSLPEATVNITPTAPDPEAPFPTSCQ